MAEIIKIDGLAEFSRSLKKLDTDLPKALRMALNDSTAMVIDEASMHVPTRTGRAKASIKARSSRTESRIAAGGARVPYYAWLDFGGEGRRRGRPPARPFMTQGRFLYAAFFRRRAEFDKALGENLLRVASAAGLEVT
jgi:hypothetical protein